MAEDGRALQVVDVGDTGTVAAQALLNLFCYLIRFSRSVDDAFVKRRHRARNVVRQGSLAAQLVPNAVFTD